MCEVQVGLNDILEKHRTFENNLYNTVTRYSDNVVISPLAVHSFLALTYQGSSGDTKEDFARELNLTDVKATFEDYKNIILYLNSLENLKLRIDNKVFLNKNYEIRETFKLNINNYFLSEVESLDFTNYEDAVESIKSWPKDRTNNKIGELFSDSSFNSAVYFDGKWEECFDAKNTAEEVFFLNEYDTIKVQMMNVQHRFNYKDDQLLNAKILELPYSNSDVSLIVILPNDKNGISAVEQKLTETDLSKITENMASKLTHVSLPKFKFQQAADLDNTLREMGFYSLTKNADDFHEICACPVSLCMHNITERAFIELNEVGTEATEVAGCLSLLSRPVIYEMNLKVNIANRFAKTLIVSKVKNIENTAKAADFTVALPENAFVSEFVMEIDGKSYKSYVKEKEEAKQIFDQAVAAGQSAGHVAVSARDTTNFSVSINIEPRSHATFFLTYEELLQRRYDQYELVLNIHPGQIVDSLNVEVQINETRPLKYVKTPALRTGNEVSQTEEALDPASKIQIKNATTAVVKFNPDTEKQKLFARALRDSEFDGLNGQFIVQYDVERDPQGGEVLLQDGYFVHFFAPSDLESLSKHVVFVLDTSGSMGGRPLEQLQEAMISILSEIRKNDMVNIVEFDSRIIAWDINLESPIVVTYGPEENYHEPFYKFDRINLPAPTFANEEFLAKAKSAVKKMRAKGGTHIIGGLEMALYLIKIGQEKLTSESTKYQPIIVFLTDGAPNEGISSTEEIVEIVTSLNHANNKAAIFSLSFGEGADKMFLRQLSLRNMGFSRHIYEAADASLQLQQFYKQISSPLLSNVEFKYDNDVDAVTRLSFPIFFRGSELVVTGRCRGATFPSSTISSFGRRGQILLRPVIERPITSLERLWAYLTVKQLLEERDTVDDETELKKRALDIALKYSFVTDVSSLVVVKPNQTDAVKSNDIDENSNSGQLSIDDLPKCIIEELPEEVVVTDWDCPKLKKKVIKKRVIKKEKGDFNEVVRIDAEDEDTIEEVLPDPKEKFVVNHPFIIILQFKKGNRRGTLFKGRIMKPDY